MNRESLRELFHENTKNFETDQWYSDPEDVPESWTTVEYRTYPRCPSVGVEYPGLGDSDSLETLLEQRASPDQFASEPVSFEDICAILNGAKETHTRDGMTLRAYPSGGARYAPELYLSTRDVEGLADGVYHFSVRDDELERICENPIQDEIAVMAATDQPSTAPVIGIVTAVFDRTEEKYGIRGYRYAHLCAGHLIQNLLLCSEAIGLSGRPWGDFHEQKLDSILPLSESETAIYTALFGWSSA